MDNQRKSASPTPGFGVGISSLLVIFIILCLTTFASLSAVSAAADLRLAQKTADVITTYYEADSIAEERLAQLGYTFANLLSEDSAMQASTTLETAVTELGWVANGLPMQFTTSIPMGERQSLEITVDASDLAKSSLFATPRIVRWQVVNTTPWVEDGSVDVWGGPPMQ